MQHLDFVSVERYKKIKKFDNFSFKMRICERFYVMAKWYTEFPANHYVLIQFSTNCKIIPTNEIKIIVHPYEKENDN